MRVYGNTPALSTLSVTNPMRAKVNGKLRECGTEFESMLLNDVFSKLRASFSMSDATDPAHDTLNAIADEALSKAIASRGGFGLGTKLTAALSQKNI